MKTLTFQTSLGVVQASGPLESFDGPDPIVLGITGAYAPENELSRLQTQLPSGVGAIVAHLPGNHCPELNETSIPAFSCAFDEMLSQIGKPAAVLGISTGSLVALAMKRQLSSLAIEPFMATGKLWPIIDNIRHRPEHNFLQNVFGYWPDRIENRDYRHLIDQLSIPTLVLVGSEPLNPKRPIGRYPSFLDEEDREYISSSRFTRLEVMPNTGHAVHHQTAMRKAISIICKFLPRSNIL